MLRVTLELIAVTRASAYAWVGMLLWVAVNCVAGSWVGGTGRWALPQGGLEILWPVAQHSYTKLTILKTKLCFTCGE